MPLWINGLVSHSIDNAGENVKTTAGLSFCGDCLTSSLALLVRACVAYGVLDVVAFLSNVGVFVVVLFLAGKPPL